MKKTLFAAAVAAVTLPGLASAESVFNGGYAGAQVGWVNATMNMHARYKLSANPALNDRASTTTRASDNNVVGGLFLGYGMTLQDQYYVGAEVYGQKDKAEIRTSSGSGGDLVSFSIKSERERAYGAAARLGFLLNKTTLLYARLGVERGHFKTTLTDNLVRVSGSFKQKANAFVPGLGVESALSNNLALRLDWTFAMYDKVQRGGLDPAIRESNVRLKPQYGAVQLGVAYRFGK